MLRVIEESCMVSMRIPEVAIKQCRVIMLGELLDQKASIVFSVTLQILLPRGVLWFLGRLLSYCPAIPLERANAAAIMPSNTEVLEVGFKFQKRLCLCQR